MNKPLPWNVKGVGFDAREAARIAAKRAGVPLGEWLNGVISARAAELGVQADDVEADDRLEAIAARLSQDDGADTVPLAPRWGGRSAAVALADAPGRIAAVRAPADVADPWVPPSRHELEPAWDRAAHSTNAISPDDVQHATAGNALDKRTPVRGRTPGAEAAQLDARLATILEKLNQSFAAPSDVGTAPAATPDAPLRALRPPLSPAPAAMPAPAATPRPEPAAAVDAAAKHSNETRRDPDGFADLHAAFKDLARRLDRQATMPELSEAGAAAAAGAAGLAATDLAAEIAALGQRVDHLRDPVGDRDTRRVPEMEVLRREMAQLSTSLSQLAPHQSLASLEAAVRELAGQVDLSRLDGVGPAVLAPVERLGREMREAIRAVDTAPALDGLRRDMAAMSARVETLQPRESDPKIMAGLRRELREMREAVGALADRIGTADRLQTEVVALGGRVNALAERTSPAVAHDLGAAVGDIRNLLRGFAENGILGALDEKVDALATRVEALANPHGSPDLLRDLSERIDRAHDGLVARLSRTMAGSDMTTLHDRIGDLSGKIDAISRSSHDVNALYGLVGNLADRLEEARNPLAGAEALNGLQTQIGALAERLDRTGSSDASLQGIERLIGDLFLQIEQSRNVAIDAAENAARAAAQDTLRAAMDNPALNGAELTVQTGLDVDHVSQELAELRRVQEASDRRVNTTLTALNTTLERLVDRLAADGSVKLPPAPEAPVAAPAGRRRSGRVPPEPVIGGREAETLPAFDPEQFLVEPGSGDARDRFGGAAALEALAADHRTPDAPGLSAEVAPLIAAARRAAQAAQQSALEASLKVDAPGEATAPASKTRSFFASRRRALLLGLAGLVLAAGTLQIVRLTGHNADAGSAMTETDDPAPAETKDDKPAVSEPKPAPLAAPASSGAAAATPAVPSPPGGGASLLTSPATPDKVAGGLAAPAGTTAAAAPATSDAPPTGLSQSLRDLAADGSAAAQYEVGSRLSDGRGLPRDAKQAFTWFQRAAQQGFAPAQYRLGSLYEKGVGVSADPALAVAWYEKAAGQGNVRAMHNLAVMSAEGAGGKPDYGKAVTWFTKAASYGVRDSQFNLAVLFARGLGVPQNLGQSYAWFAVAAQQGDTDAVAKRDTVAAKLDGKALADAKATVAAFHPLTPEATTNEVPPPPGGWDGATTAKAGPGARKSEARLTTM